MDAVFNKELLSWYLTTLKLKEIVETNTKPQLEPSDSPWIISIHKKLCQAEQYEKSCTWATQSIYRVPKHLHEVDKTAYTPRIVSVGPYHRGRRHLKAMERHKWRALHKALDRTQHDVRRYLSTVRSIEGRARACYEAPLPISSDDFVECLVLDAVFVLELFLGCNREGGFQGLGYDDNDPVFGSGSLTCSLQLDMIMLENQLPLFVLDCILELLLGPQEYSRGLVARFALVFFNGRQPTQEVHLPAAPIDPYFDVEMKGALHCLDVFRRRLLTGVKPGSRRRTCWGRLGTGLVAAWARNVAACPWSISTLHCLDVFRRKLLTGLINPGSPPRTCWGRLGAGPVAAWARNVAACPWSISTQHKADTPQFNHCVSELLDAGIEFRRRESNHFWDVQFKDGVLYIPRLFIQDGTKSVFLNLIAFEQCKSKCTKHIITAYICFMDKLIDSKVDVEHLHHRGIIEHWLGNDGDVADMFNQLCQEVVFGFDESYLSKLLVQVNMHYNRKWNTWRANLKQNYFSNPWAIISVMAAIVLLLLTLAQTFYAMYGYYKPN